MLLYWRQIFVLASMVTACGCGRSDIALTTPINVNTGETPSSSLQWAGKQLRAELKKTSEAAHDLSPNEESEIARNVLLNYIPIGTSFDDAEVILTAAGFIVRRPRPTRDAGIDGPTDRVTATLNKMSEAGTFFKLSVNLFVYLFPKTPGKYDYVSQVEVFVDIPMP